jgi:hypothetical protein
MALAGASLLIAMAVACTNFTDHPPPAGSTGSTSGGAGTGGGSDAGKDASSADASTDGSTTDAGTCTSLPNTASPVVRLYVVGDAPAMTGGAIADGIYDVTDAKVYVGPTGPTGTTGLTEKVSVKIAGTVMEAAVEISGAGASKTLTSKVTLATNATALTTTQTCPTPGAPVASEYTATATTLTISSPPSAALDPTATREVTVYTKR